MGFVTFVFFVRDDICWSRDNTAKVSEVQKSVSCSLGDYCDSMRRISRLLMHLNFAARYQKLTETKAVLFLDTVTFGNKILWLPANIKTYAMRLELIHPNKLGKFKGW